MTTLLLIWFTLSMLLTAAFFFALLDDAVVEIFTLTTDSYPQSTSAVTHLTSKAKAVGIPI